MCSTTEVEDEGGGENGLTLIAGSVGEARRAGAAADDDEVVVV